LGNTAIAGKLSGFRGISTARKGLGLCLIALVVALAWVDSSLAGANPYYQIAVHVRQHDARGCRGFPVLRSCVDISTTYPGCGDIDVMPVFFYLIEYTGVEFGMTWPIEWGSMSWIRCAGDVDDGSIINPGDGTRVVWNACQTTWVMAPGFGWVVSSGAGRVCIVEHPATWSLCVYDCYSEWYARSDSPHGLWCAGVCGEHADAPCLPATEPTTFGSIKALFR
jgi:hypothetical protein